MGLIAIQIGYFSGGVGTSVDTSNIAVVGSGEWQIGGTSGFYVDFEHGLESEILLYQAYDTNTGLAVHDINEVIPQGSNTVRFESSIGGIDRTIILDKGGSSIVNGSKPIEESFTETVVFKGSVVQPSHNQTGDINLDIAPTGHITGESTLTQQIVGNGNSLLTASAQFLAILEGDVLSNTMINTLFYVRNSDWVGDVYNSCFVTNKTRELLNPVILAAVVGNSTPSVLDVAFSEAVNVAGIVNTSINFTVGTPKTILSVSGTGTTDIEYTLSANIEDGDVFTIDYASPSDIVATDDATPLFVPVSKQVTNGVITDTFPIIASSVRRWDSHTGVSQDDNLGFVSAWQDQVVSANLVQAVPTTQPALLSSDSDFNNQPSLDFDGIDDLLKDSSLDLSGTDKVTVYTVCKMRDLDVAPTDVFRTAFSYGSTEEGSFYFRDTVTPDYFLSFNGNIGTNSHSIVANAVGGEEIIASKIVIDTTKLGNLDTFLEVNGSPATLKGGASDNTGNLTNLNFIIGAWGTARFGNMTIAACYIFTDEITGQDDTDVKTYITNTYGV